jgi:hypothetical protein
MVNEANVVCENSEIKKKPNNATVKLQGPQVGKRLIRFEFSTTRPPAASANSTSFLWLCRAWPDNRVKTAERTGPAVLTFFVTFGDLISET